MQCAIFIIIIILLNLSILRLKELLYKQYNLLLVNAYGDGSSRPRFQVNSYLYKNKTRSCKSSNTDDDPCTKGSATIIYYW